jgi:hypothetical protein
MALERNIFHKFFIADSQSNVNDSETNHSDRLTVLCRGEIYCAVYRDLSSRVNGGEEILPPNLPLHYVSPVVRNYAETHQSLLPVSGSIFSISLQLD